MLGRFTQADTITSGGTQGWDRYVYVNNNPIINTDPTGHTTCYQGNCVYDVTMNTGQLNDFLKTLGDFSDEITKAGILGGAGFSIATFVAGIKVGGAASDEMALVDPEAAAGTGTTIAAIYGIFGIIGGSEIAIDCLEASSQANTIKDQTDDLSYDGQQQLLVWFDTNDGTLLICGATSGNCNIYLLGTGNFVEWWLEVWFQEYYDNPNAGADLPKDNNTNGTTNTQDSHGSGGGGGGPGNSGIPRTYPC